jgi:hypothetical protein
MEPTMCEEMAVERSIFSRAIPSVSTDRSTYQVRVARAVMSAVAAVRAAVRAE